MYIHPTHVAINISTHCSHRNNNKRYRLNFIYIIIIVTVHHLFFFFISKKFLVVFLKYKPLNPSYCIKLFEIKCENKFMSKCRITIKYLYFFIFILETSCKHLCLLVFMKHRLVDNRTPRASP